MGIIGHGQHLLIATDYTYLQCSTLGVLLGLPMDYLYFNSDGLHSHSVQEHLDVWKLLLSAYTH